MSSYISSYTNKKPFIHQRESSTSSSGRSSSDSYYSDKYYSSSSSTSSMANKDYRSSSGPRVEHLRDPHADLKKVKVTHRDGTSTYEYRAGRSEDNAPSSSEAYDYQNYHKSSEIKERRDRDKKSKSSSRR